MSADEAHGEWQHEPVLVAEVVKMLVRRGDERIIDATVGLGGHAAALLGAGAGVRVLGIDRDGAAVGEARVRLGRFGERAAVVQGRFGELAALARVRGFEGVDGVLFDLGVSSMQLEDGARGFSVREEGPLDMRMDRGEGLTAEDIVNEWEEGELERVLREGGEPLAGAVARAIVRRRVEGRIRTTCELARLVSGVYYRRGWKRSRVHPATRTFQALRMAVNREIEELKAGLAGAREVVGEGGRIAVISFHSEEDRVVKVTFRGWEREERIGEMLTKRPIEATEEEVRRNPRARSAKLRVFERRAA